MQVRPHLPQAGDDQVLQAGWDGRNQAPEHAPGLNQKRPGKHWGLAGSRHSGVPSTMANSSITQQINRQTVAVALQAARTETDEHQAWINAINKAALNVEACGWAFDDDVLQVASATTAAVLYTVDHAGWGCKAGQARTPLLAPFTFTHKSVLCHFRPICSSNQSRHATTYGH